jgi:hypothetical protein
MNQHPNRQADGMGEDMVLAGLDHLLCRIAARSTRLGRLNRLAVDNSGAWACLAAGGLAHHQQHMVDGLPYRVVSPGIEIPLHDGEWRESLGSSHHWQPDWAM